MNAEYTDAILKCLSESAVKTKIYHMPDAEELRLKARSWAVDFLELGFTVEQIRAGFKAHNRRPNAEFPAMGNIISEVNEAGPTQARIDEHKYRSLKFKQSSPSWFLGALEEKFISDYERGNPQITNQRPKYPGLVEDEQPRIERGGSGFKRIGFDLGENNEK